MQLETERLILRAWQEDDAESLYKYAKNPKVGPVAGWSAHTSVENSRDIIKTVLGAEETYAVVLKATGEVIGSIGFMLAKELGCEVGYWIGEPFWGQGLIPEAVNELLRHAFEDLGIAEIWCRYYEGNDKSKRVIEKCGFIFDHTEFNKPVPLLKDFRTEHFTKIEYEDWKAKI